MKNAEFALRGKRVVFSDSMRPACLHVAEGRIRAITAYEYPPAGLPLEEAGELVVLPGLVDTHVHVNEPGRTHWEGFCTATRAAAAGGVTTLLDMPLNSIPATVSQDALQAKIEAAQGQCWVDVGFLGGVVPGNQQELPALWRAGVPAFKCFLVDSGVPEFAPVGEADLRAALPLLAQFPAPLLAHAELAAPMEAAQRGFLVLDPAERRRYVHYLESRPDAGEVEAIRLLIRLCREFRTPVHIVHLSSALALDDIQAARDEGLPLTVETCPHYLFFDAERIPDGATEYKCAPPLRCARNRELLWEALRRGIIDLIATDHSPSPPEGKARQSGDFAAAWGGVASLQFGLAAVWTEARRRGFTPVDLARWMGRQTARLAGLQGRKGEIAAGADADLVIWDPDASWTVEESQVEHRHKLTPYAGQNLFGKTVKTFVRGQLVFDAGRFGLRPAGELLLRNSSRES